MFTPSEFEYHLFSGCSIHRQSSAIIIIIIIIIIVIMMMMMMMMMMMFSTVTVFANVLFMHQVGENYAPGA